MHADTPKETLQADHTPVILNENVEFKLKVRLWAYLAVGLALSGSIIYHLATDQSSVLLTCLGFLIGVMLGHIVSRMYKISWDHGAQTVIARFDDLGVVVLILYVIFEFSRNTIVGFFVHGPELVGISLAVFDGIMIGRVLGIRGKIKQIFEEQNIS